MNEVLASLSGEFERAYARTGRPSIPPEKLLRALLLQAFYSIRSERQLMEQLDFSLLFRWFVGLGIDDPVWDVSSFCHNRERFLEAEISASLLNGVVAHKKVRRLLSCDHFSVDGTLIEAWASMKLKSFRPRGAAAMAVRGATAGATSVARSVPTRPMKAPPIRRPGFTARAAAGRAAFATSAMR